MAIAWQIASSWLPAWEGTCSWLVAGVGKALVAGVAIRHDHCLSAHFGPRIAPGNNDHERGMAWLSETTISMCV